MDKSEVIDLAALVSFQKNSIVSQTLIKKNGGNISIFAFDQGQELSDHTSPQEGLLSVLGGTAQISIDGSCLSSPLKGFGSPPY